MKTPVVWQIWTDSSLPVLRALAPTTSRLPQVFDEEPSTTSQASHTPAAAYKQQCRKQRKLVVACVRSVDFQRPRTSFRSPAADGSVCGRGASRRLADGR